MQDGKMKGLIEDTRMRESIYRMFSSLYFTELTSEQVKSLAETDLSGFEDIDPDISAGAHEIASSLRHINSGTREELAVDYAHTFLSAGTTKHEKRACPYESVFTSPNGLLMQDARDDAYRIMLGEHIAPNESLKTPEDHIAFEFEFMADLCANIAAAFEAGEAAETMRLLDVQKLFYETHIANWIDAFCDAIEGCCRTSFYRGVAQMTRGFVHLDGAFIEEGRAAYASLPA